MLVNDLVKSKKRPEGRDELQMWSSNLHWLMALICWSDGLATCWRFPVSAKAYGGGAFLVPYILSLVFCAIPYTFVELGIGQYSNKGAIDVWDMCPIFRGVGYCNILMLVFISGLYNNTASHLLYYAISVTATNIPWARCDPSWAQINCFTYENNSTIQHECIEKYGEKYCRSLKWENSVSHFFSVKILNTESKGINWIIMYCCIFNTVIIFLLNIKGKKSMEKVLGFITIYPYIALFILLFVSLIDPGSGRGLKYFLTPDFSKLLLTETYNSALTQILFSMGFGFGGLINLGSEVHFRSAAHRESIAINLFIFGISICYVFLVYISMGVISYHLNLDLSKVVNTNESILFTLMPLAILYLPGSPQIWGIVFYSTTYIICMRSQAMMIATVLNIFYDKWNKLLKNTVICSACCCIVLFISGLPRYIQNGVVLFNEFDEMLEGPVNFTLNLFQCIGIMWFYGFGTFVDDFHFMLGFRPSPYWQISWLLGPFIFCYGFMSSLHIIKRKMIKWCAPYSWMLFITFVAIIFAQMIMKIVIKERKKEKLLQPSKRWGPVDPILKRSREMFLANSMTKEYLYRQNRLKTKVTDGEDSSSSDECEYII